MQIVAAVADQHGPEADLPDAVLFQIASVLVLNRFLSAGSRPGLQVKIRTSTIMLRRRLT